MLNDEYFYSEAIQFLRDTLKDRGESHGIEHAIAVHRNCRQIWFELNEQKRYNKEISTTTSLLNQLNAEDDRFTPWFFISVSALLHDVCDHKYEDGSERLLRNFIEKICARNYSAVQVIFDIIDNVSFSKENKGLMNTKLPSDVVYLRNVVSDADKLEAIGEVGIERCFAYRKELDTKHNCTDEDILRDVLQHCDEKLLRLVPEYFRTVGGREMGKHPHEFMVKWRHENSL